MPDESPTGLRERNKSEKLRRIRGAARRLFEDRGFAETSMRDIAHHAHVGLATLFLYADSKRDLLFLAFSEDLEMLAAQPFDAVDASLPLLDQLVCAFAPFFGLYAGNRDLARDLLREIAIYTSGQQSGRFQEVRETTVGAVERLIRRCRERGTVGPEASDAALAHLMFDLFTASLRRWLGGEEETAAGLLDLREQFQMVIGGFNASGIDAA